MSELLRIADELYGVALGEFTGLRDRRAKDLKGTDAELAAAVKRLRKPSTAAWVVNQLVRHESEQVAQVLELGAALREAQAAMSGEELRALTRQRRQLTSAVSTRARAVARARGLRVTEAVATQIEATLTAAMTDPDGARAVRSGLLVAGLEATGVGDLDPTGALALPDALGFEATSQVVEAPGEPERHLRAVADPDADLKARRAAESALEDAEELLASAQEAYATVDRRVDELEARSMQLQADVDELRRRLARAEATYEEVDDQLADAEESRAEAEDVLTEARRDREAAVRALSELS